MPAKIRNLRPHEGRLVKTHESSGVNTNTLHPRFCFHKIQRDYCLNQCSHEQKANFAMGLQRRGSMTWAELIQAPRDGLGQEIIANLNVPRPASVSPDVNILSFRIGGLERMIGYRDGQDFHVIWVDVAGAVYDHG